MSCAQAHWVGSKPIHVRRVMQLKLHKPTMAIGYSLRMCARHVDWANAGRSNLVFRSKPIPEAEMSNRLIACCIRSYFTCKHSAVRVSDCILNENSIHSFIHSGHFYSAPSSPLLLRGAPDYSTDTVRRPIGVSRRSAQATAGKGLAQGPYVGARAGVEPTTLRLKVIVSTKAPPRPLLLLLFFFIALRYFIPPGT